MKNFATWVLLLLVWVSISFAQREGSKEIGGALSVWTSSASDSTNAKVAFRAMWVNYLSQKTSLDFMPEIMVESDSKSETVQMDALLALGLSRRLTFTTNFDPRNREARQKMANDASSALIMGLSVGAWAANDPLADDRVHVMPAYSVYLTTRSKLSSLAYTRTMLRYTYVPGDELYGSPLSLITLSFGVSMIYRL